VNRESLLVIKILAFLVFLNFSAQSSNAIPSDHPRKIVVFKKWYGQEADQDALLRNFGAVKIKRLNLINSQAVHLPPGAEKYLKRKSEILRIDEDLVITAVAEKTKPKPKRPHPPPKLPEKLPWGIERIYADLVWEVTTGSMIKVAILDTGIDLDHPDLWSNIKGGINIIKPHKSANDDGGHGTHLAGSLEGNQSFHDAIIRAYQAGITMVASAGNNGEDSGLIEYPAFYPETIAVSAVGQEDEFASFSSYGPTMYGTSMSAAHVTGTVALILTTSPKWGYDLDNDRIWDPDEIRERLMDTAENLGLHPHQQGAGLI